MSLLGTCFTAWPNLGCIGQGGIKSKTVQWVLVVLGTWQATLLDLVFISPLGKVLGDILLPEAGLQQKWGLSTEICYYILTSSTGADTITLRPCLSSKLHFLVSLNVPPGLAMYNITLSCCFMLLSSCSIHPHGTEPYPCPTSWAMRGFIKICHPFLLLQKKPQCFESSSGTFSHYFRIVIQEVSV